MQDPNEDTEWNDILRSKGILPPKPKEVTEDEILEMMDDSVKKQMEAKSKGYDKPIENMNMDELNELEDLEDERVLQEYRAKRMAEIVALKAKPTFGSLLEITASDYITQVNKAGNDIWVVLHLYLPHIPLCNLINKHLRELAVRFPHSKFIKSVATDCIKNYPDYNIPTIFIYYQDDMKAKFIGPHTFDGMNLRIQDLEWMLSETGAINTKLKSDPRNDRAIKNVFKLSNNTSRYNDNNDDNDSD